MRVESQYDCGGLSHWIIAQGKGTWRTRGQFLAFIYFSGSFNAEFRPTVQIKYWLSVCSRAGPEADQKAKKSIEGK